MSKSIKIDKSFIEAAKADFLKMCDEGKFVDGKIVFNRTFGGNTNRKATLYIEDIAWNKMKALVDEFDKEVAWHGIAKRREAEGEYIIEDILVYPQTVTAATVVTDQEKYQMWLYEQEDDVFNNIRMQGHSHVNMGTTPSGVDTTYYQGIIDQMSDDMFYIFMILNKKGSRHVEIWDKKINTIFETADITVTLLIDPDDPVNKLIKDAKEKVKDEPKPATPTYNYSAYKSGGYTGYTGYTGYSGYSGSYYGNNQNYGTGKYGAKSSTSSTTGKPIVDADKVPGLSASEYSNLMDDPYGWYDGY